MTVQGELYASVGEVGEPLNIEGEGRVAKLNQFLLFEGGIEYVYVI